MYSKSLICIFTSLGSMLMVQAFPHSSPNIGSHLYPRANPCEPGGTPVLYKEYHADLCPPFASLAPDGSCPLYSGESCITEYCEVRQSFYYAQEKPVVNNPYCHGPLTCTVTKIEAFTYTYTGGFSFSAAWAKAFTTGVTGGFSYADTTTNLQSTSVTLKAGECGYFTFLPILHSSCGTITEGIFDKWNSRCVDVHATSNVCTEQPAKTADGKQVLGTTVFVKTDCGNNERLPMDQQDPAYQHDGVAQPQSVYESFITAYSTPAPPSYATGWCGMHIVQYQKNEPGNPDHPANPEYVVDVSLFDAHQQPIPLKNCNGCGNTARAVALKDKANYVESNLPWGMEVTVGATDGDAIRFAYGDQTWDSNDQQHSSNFGSYDNGMRNGDTGFKC